MIYARWLALSLLDWLLLLATPVGVPVALVFAFILPWQIPVAVQATYWVTVCAIPVVAAIYREQPYGLAPYSWGWIWGTYDNPPQGDQGFVRERAPFPGYTTGWRGYLNRCMWMIRNPLYGYARKAAVDYSPSLIITHKGDESISDKYKRPGWYFAKAENLAGQTVAFEFYCVLPWLFGRCLRARLGWKIMTDKFQRYGFAQLVNTCNPFDGYGE